MAFHALLRCSLCDLEAGEDEEDLEEGDPCPGIFSDITGGVYGETHCTGAMQSTSCNVCGLSAVECNCN